MSTADGRWIQRLNNYERTVSSLETIVRLAGGRPLTKAERSELIKHFVVTHELSWKLIKDYFEERGDTGIRGSGDAFRLAHERGLVQQGDTLMQAIGSRVEAGYIYNEDIANKITNEILQIYYPAYEELLKVMQAERDREGS